MSLLSRADIYAILVYLLFILCCYLLLFFFWARDKIKYLLATLGIKRTEETPETASTEGKYDVFLSFAGTDTDLNFTDHIYKAFSRSGINAFRDNVRKERGEVISHQLQQAIKGSLCAVVVLSKNYAKSTWCLEELKMILHCRRKLGQQVFPIFCVDQTQKLGEALGEDKVKNWSTALSESGSIDTRGRTKLGQQVFPHNFGEALAKHEKKFGRNKVQNWRNALSEICSLDGRTNSDLDEADLINNIIRDVWRFLSTKLPSFNDNLVGINSKVADLIAFMEIGLDDKRFVVIRGKCGVGKTTLARVVYKKISCKFDVCCFIAKVRDTLQKKDVVHLQKRLLPGDSISDQYEGQQMIINSLSGKKVLFVLDDVDNRNQLDNLAESPYWFGEGSRILITTRNSDLLPKSQEPRMYDMETMNDDESLLLFSKIAFRGDIPEKDYLDLSNFVVECVGGLPLAIKVLGSYLHRRSRAEWKDFFGRLKQFPNSSIVQVLQNYEGLNEEVRTIFLDIVCFFKGWLKKEVTQILKSCDLDPIGIKVLISKDLLVETEDCRLEMHDVIEELGRYIVHQESPKNVGKRSRLWKFEDIKEVLENNKGSEAIQAIACEDNYWYKIEVHPKAFSKMSSIRLLLWKDMKTHCPLISPTGFKLPASLKVVQWPSFPLEALPLKTPLDELVPLKIHKNIIKQLWNVIKPMKMKFIDLSDSENFNETPDFSGVPCLEHLRLRSCKSLEKVHPSLGELKELVEVNLHGCLNFKSLPRKLKTNSLSKLDLGGCEKVEELPEFGKGLEKLSYLDVSGTGIKRLPESFGSLTGLRYLNLSGCCKICNFDDFSLKVMPLKELYLGGCGLNDGSILHDIGSLSSLMVLNLSHNDFVNLPADCVSCLSRLLFVSLDFCKKLESLPSLPRHLIRLNASHCDSIKSESIDEQLRNLVTSLDHEYRGSTKYVISEEQYDDAPPMIKHSELKYLPLSDFFAIVPGSKIPSWFRETSQPQKIAVPKKDGSSSTIGYDFKIKVEIPMSCSDERWFGIVVCLNVPDYFGVVISWSSKAQEDDVYIDTEWAHHSTIENGQSHHLRIMVLKLNHLKAGGKFDIKLCARNHGSEVSEPWNTSVQLFKWECKWRVLSEEDMQRRCNELDLNRHTPPQLAHDEVKLPSRLLDQLYGSAFAQWSRDDVEEDVSDDRKKNPMMVEA